jgi:arylsulfatase
MLGNRAIYRDGWIATTTPPVGPWTLGVGKLPAIDDYKWELYHVADDFSEANDLAAKNPDKLHELQSLFMSEAKKYQVLPLDNDFLQRVLTPRPGYTAGRDEFVYTNAMTGIPATDSPNIIGRSFTIDAAIEVPKGREDGVIVTEGGRFGGYGLYLLHGKPVFTYNLLALERFRWEGASALAPGRHAIKFDFTYAGPGPGKGGTGVLSVDGREVARRDIPHTTPFLTTIDETFDVGSDTRTPVDDRDYSVPFAFTGKIVKVAVKIGPSQLAPPAAHASAP